MNERLIVEKLKSQLESKFINIWIHKKVSASKEFKDKVLRELTYLPILQPEFDLVFETFSGELNAIEVKYLKSSFKGHNLPFYHGMGQALALSRFGFDHVGLWLIVDENVSNETLKDYGMQAWRFLRNQVHMPIEYSFFKINYLENDFKLMVYDRNGEKLLNIDDRNFKITWKIDNPIKEETEQKSLRSNVEWYLKRKLGAIQADGREQ